jgi:hypothetical protein
MAEELMSVKHRHNLCLLEEEVVLGEPNGNGIPKGRHGNHHGGASGRAGGASGWSGDQSGGRRRHVEGGWKKRLDLGSVTPS